VNDVQVNLLGLVIAVVSVVSSGMQQIMCGTMQRKHRLSSHQLLSNTAYIQVGPGSKQRHRHWHKQRGCSSKYSKAESAQLCQFSGSTWSIASTCCHSQCSPANLHSTSRQRQQLGTMGLAAAVCWQ
jgi:hypothetical protein